jgi:hypothetical protein
MKTTQQMFSALCSLVLLAGCVEPGGAISEEDETFAEKVAADDDVAEGDEASDAPVQMACARDYPNDTGSGQRTSAIGCFQWGDMVVRYKSNGAVSDSGCMDSLPTPANPGDFEIVAFGAGKDGGGSAKAQVDTFFNEPAMERQRFQPIGVIGSKDKKVEMWVRQNSGQPGITPPREAKAYNLLVIDGSTVSLNLEAITRSTVQSADSSAWDVPPLSNATHLNVVAYYGDDAFEILDSRGGEVIFNKWGFGDSDSLNVIFYEPYGTPPSTISVKNHDGGKNEYVGIRAHFRRL